MAAEKPDNDINSLWRRGRSALRNQLGETLSRRWIDPIRGISADDERIVLACPSQHHRDTVVERWGEQIADLLARLSNKPRDVTFIFVPEARVVAERVVDGWTGDATLPAPQLVAGSVQLDRALTFKNFVVGASNETALRVAEGFANGTAACANPLLFFGATGVGKSHLLHSIAWRVLERDPAKRVLYLTAERFLQMFLASLHERDTQAFKTLVRSVDVLIIDDLQFLVGKTATMEEFFFTIDDLIGRGKQVILSADGSPSLMEQLPERLRSRLVNGGGIEIGAADFDLRLAILQAMAKRRAHDLPAFVIGEDVLRMVAARVQADARVLGGVLNRLELKSGAGADPVTFEKAELWLDDFLRAHNRRVSLGEIKTRVAAYYKVKVSDLESPCRRREFVRPRQVAFFLSRGLTQRSFPRSGRAIVAIIQQ
jgi:chromosomal replication initiator protein